MEAQKKVIEIYRTTKIWQHFERVAEKVQVDFLKELVEYSIGVLDRIIETFPTYTLHNGQHQLNILNLYEKLLNHKLTDLTSLESEFLILAAFYHDIGMVFKSDVRENLEKEELFKIFISDNNKAAIAIHEDKGISKYTAEWYCRWSHAKRVWLYLENIDDKLVWEGNNIRIALAELCLSHNEDISYIKSDKLSNNYWKTADLKFCAILLRLADILDFDDTRTPNGVYQLLGLNDPKSKSEEISKMEWEKHFASKGFDFGKWNLENHYELDFRATPKAPDIENEIRTFLNYIESEFKSCISGLEFCSTRWKDFKLPISIDKTCIMSQGYTYGEFKFSLDQDQVLSLLMGDNLYENKYVFIRELLQNAIDTSRYREFHERNSGNKDFNSQDIHISEWHDNEGHRWIRIDDYGMGMTHKQIVDFFLKVGNSFYNSDDFKVSKIKYKTDDSFTPISRFGIGLLSCFMIGDLIEVSTKSIDCEKGQETPIRLSLKGLHSYFVLQKGENLADIMPNKQQTKEGYRTKHGTSIAVRINPNFDLPDFNLSKILDDLLFNPEIPVYLENVGRKGELQYIKEPRNRQVFEHEFTESDIQKLIEFYEYGDVKEIKATIKIFPVYLDDYYIDKELKGLLFFIYLDIIIVKFNNDLVKPSASYYNYFDLKESGELFLRHYKDNINNSLTLNVSKLLENNFLVENLAPKFSDRDKPVFISHNGIKVPNKELDFTLKPSSIIIGAIELKDKLRLDLSVARDSIVYMKWDFWSRINFLIRKNFHLEFQDLLRHDYFYSSYEKNIRYSSIDANNDNLMISSDAWFNEKIYNNETHSLLDLLENDIKFEVTYFSGIRKFMLFKLLEIHATVKIKLLKHTYNIFDINPSIKIEYQIKKLDVKNLSIIPPLLFCEYINFSGLKPKDLRAEHFNSNHPYSKWIIMSYDYLHIHQSNHLHILLYNDDIEIINNTIAKLKKILPEDFRPENNLILTEKDFEVDFNNLT